LLFFDAAYLAEAYKQWLGEKIRTLQAARRIHLDEESDPAPEANDPQMDFAAALNHASAGLQPNTRNTRKRQQRRKQRPAASRAIWQPIFLGSQSPTMAEMIL